MKVLTCPGCGVVKRVPRSYKACSQTCSHRVQKRANPERYLELKRKAGRAGRTAITRALDRALGEAVSRRGARCRPRHLGGGVFRRRSERAATWVQAGHGGRDEPREDSVIRHGDARRCEQPRQKK